MKCGLLGVHALLIKRMLGGELSLHPCLQMQQTMWGWRLYLKQPILPASIAYIMLYFNAVLGPGGLMTAFLASRGLSGTAAALFRCVFASFPRVQVRADLCSFLSIILPT